MVLEVVCVREGKVLGEEERWAVRNDQMSKNREKSKALAVAGKA